MGEHSTDRTRVYDWNDPRRDLNHYSRYNPLLWVFLLFDLSVLLWAYLWHKRQSWHASRQTIHTDVVFGIQQCDLILEDDEVDERRKENVRETRRHLERIGDELTLRSDQLERYTDTEAETDV